MTLILLRSAGLLPVIVHGGGPEITQTMEILGRGKSEFIDGVRVTAREDVKVVEMVLTGKCEHRDRVTAQPIERARRGRLR